MKTLQQRLREVVSRAYPRAMEVTLGGLDDRSTLYFKYASYPVMAFEIEKRKGLDTPSDDYIIFMAGGFADEVKAEAMRLRDSQESRPMSELKGFLDNLPKPPIN